MATQTLIQQFAPLVYIHPAETSLPSDVNFYFAQAQLLDPNGNVVLDYGQVNPTALAATAGYNGSYPIPPSAGTNYRLRIKNESLIERWWPDDPGYVLRGQPLVNGVCTAPCYAHMRQLTPQQGYPSVAGYAIVYCFFNPFNGCTAAEGYAPYLGCHIGDWEHITVLVSQDQTHAIAVYFSRHGTGEWLLPNECAWATDANGGANHVVVYSAASSHASYPAAGAHNNPKVSVLARDFTAQGPTWSTWDTVVDAGSPPQPTTGYAWLFYSGRWGDSDGSLQSGTSPETPAFQDWWWQETDEEFWLIEPGHLGPAGGVGEGGAAGIYMPSHGSVQVVPAGGRITGFTIWGDQQVEAFQLNYVDAHQKAGAITVGRPSGTQTPVQFAADEYITSLYLNYNDTAQSNPRTISYLSVFTNYYNRSNLWYGPYTQASSGHRFITDLPDSYQVVGIFGWVGAHVNALGLIVEPATPAAGTTPPWPYPTWGMRDALPPYTLPAGSTLTGLTVWAGNQYIHAFQLTYEPPGGGTQGQSPILGGTDHTPTPVTIDLTGQQIVSLTGSLGAGGEPYLNSLIITTDQNNTYTFGGPDGPIPFTYQVPPGYVFTSFDALADTYLTALTCVLGQAQ